MTDARAGRVANKALVAGTPDARVGRVANKALVAGTPDARAGRVAIKVLIKLYIPVMVVLGYGPGMGLGYNRQIPSTVSYKVLH